MSISAFLTSKPVLATACTAGIAGLFAAASSSGGSAASDDFEPSLHSQVLSAPVSSESVPSTTRPAPVRRVSSVRYTANASYHNYKKASTDASEIKEPNWFGKSYGPSSGNPYGLSLYGCAKTLFKPTTSDTLPRHHNYSDETVKNFDETTLASRPTQESIGKVEGCFLMNLYRRGDHFLFRSEMTLKNDNVGMVLWSGVRNTTNSQTEIDIEITNYALFLEKEGNVWKAKAGYSWGGKDLSMKTKSISFHIPGGLSHFSPSSRYYGDLSVGFKGFWKEETKGGSKPFAFKEGVYPADQYSTSFQYSPRTFYGYENSTRFRYPKDTSSTDWPWKRLKDETTGKFVSFNSKDSIDAWTKSFSELQGSWKPMREHCSDEEMEVMSQEEMSVSPCFTISTGIK